MIRKAHRHDVGNLGLLVQSLAGYFLEDDDQTLPGWLMHSLSFEAFVKRIESDDFTNLIYEKDDMIIGYLCMQQHSHIIHLFVEKTQHRKGIGKALWSEALKQAQKHQPDMKFTVRSCPFAVPVFQSFGFKKSGEIFIKDGLKFITMIRSPQPKNTEDNTNTTK